MKRLILVVALSLLIVGSFSFNAFATTSCTYTVQKVYNNLLNNEVWICFVGGGCIYKTGAQSTPEQLGRMLSMGLTAHVSGKQVTVSYPGSVTCPVIENRGDAQGIWILP